ncbi:unnamed protein product [Porites lobata]|uniref:HECT domain-containing protein n=1 Tax=Porites lobata TaxID=104759 RepID=A0ABN8PDM8_9CNID|nr:unnamed protein product [Porites lobata]
MLQCLANCRDLSVIGTSWSVRDLKSALGGQAKIYLRPIQKNLSTRSQEPKLSESLLKEKCRWCQKPFLFSELREHSSHCTGNFFGDSDDDATDLPAVMSGRPDSSNNSTESSLNVPISVAAQQPANASVDLHTASSPKYSQTTQQLPLHQDSMVAATQPANYVTSPSIQATTQQLGGEAVDDARRSISNLEDILEQVAIKCADSGNPVQMLQCLQDSVVVGRALEIVNVSESLEGDVNYILVNRYNLLETAFDEIQLIENPRLTLQVQFCGEIAEDLGGPRKEFFGLILHEIKEKYFDHGLRWDFEKDYETVGLIMGMSILQNGKIPRFLTEELGSRMPTFLHLFRPNPVSILTSRKLTMLLTPSLSPEGSNRKKFETEVYSLFVKYLREAASGRRGRVSLGHVLRFITGTDEEPILGFKMQPSIEFCENSIFFPTSNTCINSLKLVRGSLIPPLPSEAELFQTFDVAFGCAYFGSV